MNRIFYSKVSWWYYALIALFGGLMIYYFWIKVILMAILYVIFTLWMVEMLIHTRYIITEDDMLKIEVGRFFRAKQLAVADIISIKSSHSLIASPALSLDRIEICFRSQSSKSYLYLSPKNKEEMAAVLKKRNEHIIVTLK